MKTNGQDIAERIRGLIGGEPTSFTNVAAGLGVDETALRIALDPVAPNPTVEVIAALVAKYGVDPAWLLTGEYNAEVHRAVLASSADELPTAIHALIRGTSPNPGSAPFRNLQDSSDA